MKIAILGSTGSIGKTLLEIISRDKKKFKIILLTAKTNYREVLKQANKFNVKNIIITDKKYYKIAKTKSLNQNIKIFNSFNDFNKIFKTKIDYVMSSIVGLDGLNPTIKIIKYTKKIAIANKETIICAWDLISKQLNKYKTKFIPVDSEHFSIWYALKNNNFTSIDKVYLTASGGSLLNIPIHQIGKINLKRILKHPNWEMGKKITIDSSTLMNKVFEIIEAKKIFNLDYNKLEIAIHPQSYIHAIIKFTDGMIKIIAHDTTMEIPIYNSIYSSDSKKIKTKKINLSKLNNLNFRKVDEKRFPLVKILKILPAKNSLYETVLVSANDALVELYLKKEIKYADIATKLIKFVKRKEFRKYRKIQPRNVTVIENLSKYVRLKVFSMSV